MREKWPKIMSKLRYVPLHHSVIAGRSLLGGRVYGPTPLRVDLKPREVSGAGGVEWVERSGVEWAEWSGRRGVEWSEWREWSGDEWVEWSGVEWSGVE